MVKKIIRHIGISALALCLLTAYVLPVYAKDVKKLYFQETNGKMTWNNVRGDDGNWFMSFTNMVPGGTYEDQLSIENGSKKTYALYMQVIPLEQSEKKNELLDLISMNVTLGNKTLYEGTASGKKYNNGNLQNVIYIGTYKPGEKEQIQVDLTLNKDVGLEYCDLLTNNDWKFMVTEVTDSETPDNPENTKTPKTIEAPQKVSSPKTGDNTNIKGFVVAIIISLMACNFVYSRKHRNK